MTTDTLPGLGSLHDAPCTPTALSLRFGAHGGAVKGLTGATRSEKLNFGSSPRRRPEGEGIQLLYATAPRSNSGVNAILWGRARNARKLRSRGEDAPNW
ncbi:hypothetical protein NDU88_002685 [Pleurodeles waltl]|uniref:Uncharacterized protein n=1 Tax=Pleurodeles waltl TaxID=8319 RepID=A0AAV7M285_PLEWA|nr:hypothetical protein NDU88_002685 [Pleurodeles waltl]